MCCRYSSLGTGRTEIDEDDKTKKEKCCDFMSSKCLSGEIVVEWNAFEISIFISSTSSAFRVIPFHALTDLSVNIYFYYYRPPFFFFAHQNMCNKLLLVRFSTIINVLESFILAWKLLCHPQCIFNVQSPISVLLHCLWNMAYIAPYTRIKTNRVELSSAPWQHSLIDVYA